MAYSRSNDTDEMLLMAIKDGNVQAFDTLFERYAERLHGFALKYVQNPYIAEELMMDVMHWLWQHRESMDNIRQVAPYLFRATRNKVYDHLRKRALPVLSLEDIPDQGRHIADHFLPSQKMELAELEQSYERSLRSLPSQCQKVFVLSREDQLSHAEISSQLNISTKTVEGHISNALKVMRRNLPSSSQIAYLLLVLCAVASF